MPKILHFEDEAMIAKMYNKKFLMNGFEHSYYSNPPKIAEEFIGLVLKEKPDLILMDLVMPEVDGFTATETLKSNDKTKDIPVIALTNMSSDENKKKGIDAGMSDYWITSKLSPDGLVEKTKKFLNISD